MPPTTRFSENAGQSPLAQDFLGLSAVDECFLPLVVANLQSTDTALVATFVAKINRTDPDSAPTTVILMAGGGSPSLNCTITPVGPSGSTHLVQFWVSQATATLFSAAHVYDVYFALTRNGEALERRVMSGTVQAVDPTVTSNVANAPPLTAPLTYAQVIAMGAVTPPVSPNDGDGYVVGALATGAWAGQTNTIAVWLQGAWIFTTPATGWRVWCVANSTFFSFNGTRWVKLSNDDLVGTPLILAGILTLDVGTYTTFRVARNADITSLPFTGIAPPGQAVSFTLLLDESGSYAVTWPSTFVWRDGTPPTLGTSGVDGIVGLTTDGGVTWLMADMYWP